MIEELKLKAEEIIDMCIDTIAKGTTPLNTWVINLINQEFKVILNAIISENKVIVLTKRKDLWAARTIIDSGEFEHDKELFQKVFDFEKACRKLKKKQLIILHELDGSEYKGKKK